MIKVLTFTKRKPTQSRAEFERYWFDVHVPLWRAIPGIRGYIASRIIATHTRADVAPFAMDEFDGVVELWYDDEASMARSAATPEGQAWRADSAVFIGGMRSFLTEEEVAVPLPAERPPIKALSVVGRPKAKSPEAFQQYWRNVHAPMARTVPGLDGFVLSRPLRALTRTDIPAFPMAEPDGFTSSFATSLAARDRMVVSAEAKRWFADGASFLGSVRIFVVEEHVLLAPPVAKPQGAR